MNRRIAFQAWHKREQKMYIPNYLYFSPEGKLFGVLVKEGQLLSIDDFELREYTGLKDSKGQEIYEGDIIKARVSKRGIVGPFIGRVYWCESQFQWWITDDKYDPATGIDYDLSFLKAYEDFEVIGNIYAYPELLHKEITA